MDIGSFLLILAGGSLVVGAAAWIVGFIHAVKQQPINDRLNTFCRRGE